MSEPATAYIGLGANLGDRERNIRTALERLATVPGVAVRTVSALRETEPVGGPPQGRYLNGVARIETHLPAAALLAVLRELERSAGRAFGAGRNHARPLDLDLLLYGDQRIDTRDLVVPHPRMTERAFVLEPLAELGVDVAAIASPVRPAVVETPAAIQERCAGWRRGGCTIGLVPTMGALHDGHGSLVRRARAECDRVVATIFVNPLQFGPHEDFARYPRTLAADLALLADAGADAAFVPGVADLIGDGFCSHVAVGAEADGLEGALRPGHFAGVATIVAILWALVRPDRAYFGQKDAQQVAVLRRVHRDLALGGELVECAIVREADGLAMSSRNVYLSGPDRQAATALSRALSAARSAHAGGERDAHALLGAARAVLEGERRCRVDYVELRDDDDLRPLAEGPVERARLLIAARVGSTRLIDNASLTRAEPGLP